MKKKPVPRWLVKAVLCLLERAAEQYDVDDGYIDAVSCNGHRTFTYKKNGTDEWTTYRLGSFGKLEAI